MEEDREGGNSRAGGGVEGSKDEQGGKEVSGVRPRELSKGAQEEAKTNRRDNKISGHRFSELSEEVPEEVEQDDEDDNENEEEEISCFLRGGVGAGPDSPGANKNDDADRPEEEEWGC